MYVFYFVLYYYCIIKTLTIVNLVLNRNITQWLHFIAEAAAILRWRSGGTSWNFTMGLTGFYEDVNTFQMSNLIIILWCKHLILGISYYHTILDAVQYIHYTVCEYLPSLFWTPKLFLCHWPGAKGKILINITYQYGAILLKCV